MPEYQSDQPGLVTIYGGSGFLGRYTVRAFAQAGWRVRVACRRPDLAFALQPLGRVGQISAVQANVRNPASVLAAARDADAVINLTGILMSKGRQSFDAVHGFGARTIARAAAEVGVRSLVHVSAIGADPGSDSLYARSKAAGETAVLEAVPSAVIVRPSIVFGPEDQFFNRFGAIARMSPILPLFGGGQSRFQPVYVADVAKALVLLTGRAGAGRTYEFGGPDIRTFEELMRYICEETGRKRLLVPVPLPLARAQAFGLEYANILSLGIWPDWLTVSRDQIALLQKDNIVSDKAEAEGRTLKGLGILPESFEAIVPTYLYRFRKTGQFETRKAV
jgi:NADH dehydrogenase